MNNNMREIFNQLHFLKKYLEFQNFSMSAYHIGQLHLQCQILEDKNVNLLINDLKDKIEYWKKQTTSELKKTYVKNSYSAIFNKLVEVLQLSDESKLKL